MPPLSPPRSARAREQRELAAFARSRGYRLGPLLGTGRLGPVYAATHIASDRPVAVRVFAAAHCAPGAPRTALWRALRQGLDLVHPALAGVLELGESRGGAVWAAVDRGHPFAPATAPDGAARDLRRLVAALAHLAAHHCAHGALAPRHLHRDAQGALLLGDAGLAALSEPDGAALPGPDPETLATEIGPLPGSAAARRRAAAATLDQLRALVADWPLSPADRAALAAAPRLAALQAALAGPADGAAAPDPLAPDRAAAPRPWPQRPLHADTQALPLVGREQERRALLSALDRVDQGEGARLVLLEGGPGLGRARLCQWAATHAAAHRGAAWLWGWHGPNGGWDQGLAGMLARHLGVAGMPPVLARSALATGLDAGAFDGPPALRTALLDWLLPVAGGAPRPPVGPLDRWRAALALIRAECTEHGLTVVVLEEGWWSSDTLGFVRFLLSEGARLPVLVLLTVRADRIERRPQAAALLDELGSDAVSGRVRVPPLGRDERDTLLRQVLGLGPALAEDLATHAGGRPLEAIELVRDLDQEGQLCQTPAGRERLEPGLPLPPTLDALWQGRVARVPGLQPGWIDALATAAVLGGSAGAPAWPALCAAAGVAHPGPLLHRSRRLGLLGARGIADPEGMRLAHGSIVPALVRLARRQGSLPTLHRRCAAAVPPSVPGPASPQHLRHLLGAQDHAAARTQSRAAVVALLAAGKARSCAEVLRVAEGAWAERRRADGSGRGAWSRRSAATFALFAARLAELQGQPEAVRAGALRLLSHARRQDWTAEARGAHLLLARMALCEGEDQEALDHARAAERLAQADGDRADLVRAWTVLGWRAVVRGDAEELAEVQQLLATTDDCAALAVACRARLRIESDLSDDIFDDIQRAMDAARRAGAWSCLAAVHTMRGDLRRRRGALADALTDYREARLWEQALGIVLVSRPGLGEGLVRLAQGHHREAARILDATLLRLETRGPPGQAAVAHLALAVISAARGGPDAVLHARQAAGLLRIAGGHEPDLVPLCHQLASAPGAALRQLVARLRRLNAPR